MHRLKDVKRIRVFKKLTGFWCWNPRSYYRDSDQKGCRWGLKPRSNIRDFTVVMPFNTLYQWKWIADWSINVRTDLIDV